MFEVKNLNVNWKTKKSISPVFSNVTFTLPENQLTTLCGVNGSGKSTLLSIMAGIIPETLQVDGGVLLGGVEVLNQPVKERAKKIAFLIQNETNAWDITARKLVENGRFTYQKWYENQTANDIKIVDDAIKALNLTELENRPIANLSGGELQRFRIARALAQETPFIFLDEPLAGLDLNFQKELMQILKSLCNKGKTICISIHDINLASTFSDNMLLLKKDRSGIIQGTPKEILSPSTVKDVFGSGFELYNHPVTGAIQLW